MIHTVLRSNFERNAANSTVLSVPHVFILYMIVDGTDCTGKTRSHLNKKGEDRPKPDRSVWFTFASRIFHITLLWDKT